VAEQSIQLGDGRQIPLLGCVVLGAFSGIYNEMSAWQQTTICPLHKVILHATI